MINSARDAQLAHEGLFAEGITAMMRHEDTADSVAASRIVAETVLMWRLICKSKMKA